MVHFDRSEDVKYLFSGRNIGQKKKEDPKPPAE